MKYYIGVDLGGTNVRVAKVSELGDVIQEVKEPSEVKQGRDHVVAKIIRMIKTLDNYQEAKGIGLAVPGPVDTQKRVMTIATNVPGFEGFEFAKIMEEELKLPVYLDNDVNAAGIGEAVLGAGKDYPIVYYVTISTGIGGAAIINGKVLSGRYGYAGEIGNIIIDRNRKKHNFLNIGAVENEASGLAIIRKASEVFGYEFTSAKELFDLAANNDPQAMKMVDELAYDIAVMLSAIAHVIDPHIFVFGGGVMKSKDVFFPLVEKHFQSLVHEKMRDVKFETAKLSEPGIIGAAMLVKEYLK